LRVAYQASTPAAAISSAARMKGAPVKIASRPPPMDREYLGKETGAEQIGYAGDACIGTLKPALLGGADMAAHQRHACRTLQTPQRQKRNTDPEQ
jgi:hypothetical protein